MPSRRLTMMGKARELGVGLSIVLAACLALGGCGGRETEEPREAGGGKPNQGDALIVGNEADADALSPPISTTVGASDIYGNMFCYLCKITPDMESYKPWIAKSWEFSDDRKTLTFHLRDDVYWHDGVQMTAADVEYSFKIHKDPVVAWSIIKWLDYIDSVTAIDKFTVEVKFSRVYPYQLTDANVFRPIPKHLLEHIPPAEMKNAEFNRNPVGNGPYKFKKWVAQQYIELEANDDYFLGRPNIDKIVFKVIPDRTNLLTQLETGEVDFYHHFPPEAYERLSKNPNLNIYKFPSRSYYHIGWNGSRPPFNNAKLRRAMNMAIDREEIIDVLCYGLAKPVNGHFQSWIWAHNPTIEQPGFDPAAAKRLLAEEGWTDSDGDGWLDKDGREFEFEIKTNQNNEMRKDIAVMVQSQLKKIGVKVVPRFVEFNTLVQDLQQRKDFDAAIMGWSVGVKADMTSHFHTRSIRDKFNYISYSSPEVDRLIDTAVMEIDRTKAKELWGEAQRLILEDAAYCFLFSIEDLNALHKRFKNVRMITYGWDYYLPEWYVPADEIKYKD
jgi:peptide/nickel transport system substrate-binding protein